VRSSLVILIISLVTAFSLGLPSGGSAAFELGISPVRWEASGNPGDTLRIAVALASGARTVQAVQVRVGDWTLTEDGAPLFAQAGELPNSAAAWLRLQPEEMSIRPRQRKIVRVSLKIPEGTPQGSYVAALFFSQPQEEAEGREAAASMFIRGQLAFLIYVTVGDAKPDGEILECAWRELASGKSLSPAVKIRNRGDAHLRVNGVASARAPSGKTFEAALPGVPILPGQTRWVYVGFPEPGPSAGEPLDLTLRLDLGRGEEEVKTRIEGK